jgi:hypothetical protein
MKWRKEMKKYLYIPLFILLSLSLASCQRASNSDLQATNEALTNQVNTLSTEVSQQSISQTESAQQPVSTTSAAVLPTVAPLPSPTPLPTAQGPAGVAPTLIFSGSGLITPWTNNTYYPIGLFGTANVHMLCNQNNTTGGEFWIDNEAYKVSCKANGESWSPWKLELTIGDHYIYSKNANDKYEFWTIGTTPFTIKNIHDLSDYIFQINNSGEYVLTANLIDGAFNIYITCQGAQNFDYKITQSMSIPVVLNPAMCELIVRDSPPGTVNPGEIEVSLTQK